MALRKGLPLALLWAVGCGGGDDELLSSLAGGWTGTRDFPAPQGKTFQQMWKERSR